MITAKQQKAIEESIFGKPVLDTELCFFLRVTPKHDEINHQLCIRLAQLYGYALLQDVDQAIPNTNKLGESEIKVEKMLCIKILTNSATWDKNFPVLSWICHAVIYLYGLSHLDMTIDGILYTVKI